MKLNAHRFSRAALAAALAAGTFITQRASTRDDASVILGGGDTRLMGAQAPLDNWGNHRGMALDHAYRTHDRARTVDSTGAFLVGELERLDQTLHMPLSAISWSRDIDLREDVTLADEFSSYTLTSFGASNNLGIGAGIRKGKAWAGKTTDQIGGVGVDTGKTPNPLTPWALEIKFSILELESAAKMGRPIDDQKYQALKLKHNLDTDEQVYVGDAVLNVGGLVNHTLVTNVSNVPNGAGGQTTWATKTPDEILADINAILASSWAASAYAVMPRRVLIPPVQFGLISTKVVSTAGNVSILKYVKENNIVTASGNGGIEILPCKWLVGVAAGGTIGTADGHDRMVAYTKAKEYVRFPMTMLSRTPVQYDSLFHKATYYGRLGVVECVYPETIAYRDLI